MSYQYATCSFWLSFDALLLLLSEGFGHYDLMSITERSTQCIAVAKLRITL